MNKERAAGMLSLLSVIGVAGGLVSFVYNRPDAFACFWRFEDVDFCYSIASLRFLDGLKAGFITHPGYPLIQLLGWFYVLAAKVDILGNASYYSFAAEQDPLLRIRDYVITGWLFGSLVYFMMVLVIFQLVRFLTRSLVVSTFASVIVALSWSNLQFVIKIRPEALSVLFGIGGLYFMFKAVHAARLRMFAVYSIIANTLVFLSLFLKLNAIPFLIVVPIVLLLKPGAALNRLAPSSANLALIHLFFVNLLIAPLTIELVKPWIPITLVEASYSKMFYSLLVLFLAAIAIVRLRLSDRLQSWGHISGALKLSGIFLGLAFTGFQLALGLSFIPPEPTISFAPFAVSYITAGLLTMLMLNWIRADLENCNGRHIARIFFWAASCFILISTGLLLTADLSFFRARPYSLSVGIASTATAVGLLFATAAILHFSRSKSVRRSRQKFDSVSALILYLIVFASAWSLSWATVMIGSRYNFDITKTSIYDDVTLVSFLIGNLDLSLQYTDVGSGLPGLLAKIQPLILTTVAFYRQSRPLEMIVIIAALLFFRQRRRDEVRLVFFFTLAGFLFILFSTLKGQVLKRYLIYEELFTILAVAICLGWIIRSVRGKSKKLNLTPNMVVTSALVAVIVIGMIGVRIGPLTSLRNGLSCGPMVESARSGACICNNFFAVNTGFKPLIEQQYGAACVEAVEQRASEGFQSWTGFMSGDRTP